MYAASQNHCELVELLKDEANMQSNEHKTALMCALENKQ